MSSDSYYCSFLLYFNFFQYLLPAIVHIQHQPFLEHGDGPIVSTHKALLLLYAIRFSSLAQGCAKPVLQLCAHGTSAMKMSGKNLV